MAASVLFRPQARDLGMTMREVDQDLAIFLGMKNGEKEKNDNDHALDEYSDEFDVSTGKVPKPDGLLTSNASQPDLVQISADDNFLNPEIDRDDYDWLLTQPETSLPPTVEVEGHDSATSHSEMSNGDCTSLKSESEESAFPSNNSLQAATFRSLESSANKRSLSSGQWKPTSRAATPTRRLAVPAKSKPTRASTPPSRATLPPSKPTAAQPRSRPSVPASSNTAPRAATPTRKPATSSTKPSTSAPDLSSSGRKTGLKNPVPSRGISQTVKSRPSRPSDTISLTHDATQNPKKSMPRRPASASRGRPSISAAHSNGKSRQKSCSPARVRNPTVHKVGSAMLSKTRGYSHAGDDVNPVLVGTKMVERVVNMRKLAPPKQDEYVSRDNSRKSSQENSGFGRSLSKKSLDMAIRHMDIRRSINEK